MLHSYFMFSLLNSASEGLDIKLTHQELAEDPLAILRCPVEVFQHATLYRITLTVLKVVSCDLGLRGMDPESLML